MEKMMPTEVVRWLITQAERMADGKRYAFALAIGDDGETLVGLLVEGEEGGMLISGEDGKMLAPPSREAAECMVNALNAESPWKDSVSDIALSCGMQRAH